ncbi:hypothetical protein ACGFNU_16260 [Spirillospora sp. NPDC048911]|uniref:hypothetical protein n=1 Tax=Spirillospora sp. NPDC048911 TaxID=3364527 RepID=UPI0037244FD6
MGVADSLWRSINMPWMLVWLATFASFAGLAVYAAAAYRRQRRSRTARGQGLIDICVYLNARLVMGIYRTSRSRPALVRQVVERTTESRSREAWGTVYGLGGGGGKEVSDERLLSYIEEKEPISVISEVMSLLEERDGVVYADLTDGTILPGPAVAKVLGGNARSLRLSDLRGHYVSVTGLFQLSEPAGDRVTFLAPYGVSPADDGPSPHVKITCSAGGMQDQDERVERFHARCLGKVNGWDPEARVLDLHPVAIFR